MAEYIKYQSFKHYIIRVWLSGFIFAVTLDLFRLLLGNSPLDPQVDGNLKVSYFKYGNIVKRVVDIAISITVLMLLSPFLVLVTLVIYVFEGYPVFYISKRLVAENRSVSILKFRTMVKDAISSKYRLNERFMRDGYLDIPLECEVYTPIGRLLERTQLVETLQLFNVILDGMSLVGNRPLPGNNIEMLQKFEGWRLRFHSPSGLTGISQIVGKFNLSPKDRLSLECLYSKAYQDININIIICDFLIIFYTIRFLLCGSTISISKARNLLEMSVNQEKT